MSKRVNFNGYSAGEPFLASGTLKDAAGAVITSGTMTMQFATTSGGTSLLDVVGVHAGAGVWSFTATSLPSTGTNLVYEIEDETGYILARGSVPVAETIT